MACFADNNVSQGSVATYLKCGGIVNNQIKKGLLLSLWVKKFFIISVSIWQSYKQEHDCLMHFALLTNTLLKDEESARDNHVLACNFTDFIFSTLRPFLIWLLKTPLHLKHAATLPYNLSLMTSFADINFHKLV